MHLSLTYSAYREMEQIASGPLREISAAIVDLADDPLPTGSLAFEGQEGCRFLVIDGYWILYHINRCDKKVTVLGVLNGPVHTLH